MTDFQAAHQAALAAAQSAAKAENEKLGPESQRGFDCGFSWVQAPEVKMNTKDGKALKALGFQKIWSPCKGAYLWSPAKENTQSISVHLAGARAYAEAMTAATGIKMFAASRMD